MKSRLLNFARNILKPAIITLCVLVALGNVSFADAVRPNANFYLENKVRRDSGTPSWVIQGAYGGRLDIFSWEGGPDDDPDWSIEAHQWKFIAVPNGESSDYRIINVATGMFLAQYRFVQGNPDNLRVVENPEDTATIWTLSPSGSYYKITNKNSGDQLIQGNWGKDWPVHTWNEDPLGHDAYLWFLKEIPTEAAVSSGHVRVITDVYVSLNGSPGPDYKPLRWDQPTLSSWDQRGVADVNRGIGGDTVGIWLKFEDLPADSDRLVITDVVVRQWGFWEVDLLPGYEQASGNTSPRGALTTRTDGACDRMGLGVKKTRLRDAKAEPWPVATLALSSGRRGQLNLHPSNRPILPAMATLGGQTSWQGPKRLDIHQGCGDDLFVHVVTYKETRLAVPVDERLTMPRNPIAQNMGRWDGGIEDRDGNNAGLIGFDTLEFRKAGFRGLFYDSCTFFAIKQWHSQHIVRMPNKDGRAYFAVTNSYDNGVQGQGSLTIYRSDAAPDPVTDLVPNLPGTDGEIVWEHIFDRASPYGSWNHPCKMEIIGGLLVVAMQVFHPVTALCEDSDGDEEALLYFDVREPQEPRYWGRMTASQIGLTGDDGTGAGSVDAVSLVRAGDRWILNIRNGHWWYASEVSPDINAWTKATGSGNLTDQHGMNFNSYELYPAGTEPPGTLSPGNERVMFFDGYGDDEKHPGPLKGDEWFEFRSVSFGASPNSFFPSPPFNSMGLEDPVTDFHTRPAPNIFLSENDYDAGSLYVTRKGAPLIYSPLMNDDDCCGGDTSADKLYQIWHPANHGLQTPHPDQVVTNTQDSGYGSLRRAIGYGGTIRIDPSLNGQTITLTKEALVVYPYDVNIDASALPDGLTIKGDGQHPVIQVTDRNVLTMKGVRTGTPSGLIAHWNFDIPSNSTVVSLANGIEGQLLNGAAISAAGGGRSGQEGDRALSLGNIGGETMRVANMSGFNSAVANDKVTVSFWQKLDSVLSATAFKGQSPSAINLFDDTDERGISVHVPWSDNNIYFDTGGCCDGITQRISAEAGAIDFLQWHHIAFVKDGSRKQIWIDGQLFHEGNNDAALPVDFTNLWIGSGIDGAESVHGSLDDFAIFDWPLDEASLVELAAGTAPIQLGGAGLARLLPSHGVLSPTFVSSELTYTLIVPNTTESMSLTATVVRPETSVRVKGLEVSSGSPSDPVALNIGENLITVLVTAENGTNKTYTVTVTRESGGETPPQPNSSGLLVSWEFNGAASGNVVSSDYGGIAGTLQNGAVIAAGEGVSGGALDLNNGTSMLVEDVDFYNEAAADDVMTLVFWQKLTTITDQTTFKAQSPSSNADERGWSVHTPWSDSIIYFDTAGCCDGSTQRINAPGGVDFSGWHHYAFVKNGEKKTIYIDGQELLTGINTAPLPNDFIKLWIGSGIDGEESMVGLLDDFAIFNQALDEASLAELAAGTTPSQLFGGLLVSWEFNGAANGNVVSSDYGGVAGTLQNGAVIAAGEGVSGGALDLNNGTSMLVEDVAFYNEAAADDVMTLVFWQKLTTITNQTTFKAQSPSSNSDERGWSVHTPWSDSIIYFDTAGCCDGSTQRINAPGGVDFIEWHHYAFVKNGENKTIYIDGQELLAGINIAPLPDDFTKLWIGSGIDGEESMVGLLDDFAIFNLALDEASLAKLAAGTTPSQLGGAEAPTQPKGFDLLNVGINPDGAFTMTIPDGVTAEIEYSTDLIEWEVIAAGVTGTFEETATDRQARPNFYYRASLDL